MCSMQATDRQVAYLEKLRAGSPDAVVPQCRCAASRLISALKGGRETSPPVSERQKAFIASLAAQLAIQAPQPNNSKAASAIVSQLLSAVREARALPHPGVGVWAQAGADGSVVHVAVRGDKVFESRDTGRSWVSTDIVPQALERSAFERVSNEDIAELGHASGACAICGRTLTNEQSIAAGIGPICSARLGA